MVRVLAPQGRVAFEEDLMVCKDEETGALAFLKGPPSLLPRRILHRGI
jgi:hypothetical protein